MNNSNAIFKKHLLGMLTDRTYAQLAMDLDISENTLKSWMRPCRGPSMKKLDELADKLNCYTFDLIKEGALPTRLLYKKNNSHAAFKRNLNIQFINRQCFNKAKKILLLGNAVSEFALTSYLRPANFKMPTLEKLDRIADELGIKTYELLLEEIK